MWMPKRNASNTQKSSCTMNRNTKVHFMFRAVENSGEPLPGPPDLEHIRPFQTPGWSVDPEASSTDQQIGHVCERGAGFRELSLSFYATNHWSVALVTSTKEEEPCLSHLRVIREKNRDRGEPVCGNWMLLLCCHHQLKLVVLCNQPSLIPALPCAPLALFEKLKKEKKISMWSLCSEIGAVPPSGLK